jgi:flagellar M-ring protein FliF
MDQLRQLFATLSLKQKLTIVAAAIIVAWAGWGLTRLQHERSFRQLYTGLAPEDAAAVVQKLKESATEYRVADNGATILVAEARVPELRLEMASAGVPKSGRIGFELFDKTNLGITDFTEHVNYHRAVEGELERSVRAINQVEDARVHVTFPRDSVFVESREAAKASVLVRLRPGTRLTQNNVAAITNMVASAVEGLAPESVSVLDMSGNLLSRPRKTTGDEAEADEGLEYRDRLEKEMMAKMNSTLEPVLGEGRFRAGVTVDCDFTSGDQSEESFDPQKSVMATSQRTEDVVGGSTQSGGGVPGTASNLPQPAPRTTGGGATTSRRTENITYQTSRTVRHTKMPEGAIRRISASLLLDQDMHWEGQGKHKVRVFDPPSADRIKTIHDLIAAAIGLVPDRGDQLIIESLPFEPEATPDRFIAPPAATAAPPEQPLVDRLKTDRMLQMGLAAALLAVVTVGFLARRAFRPAQAAPVMAKVLASGGAGSKAQPETPAVDPNQVIQKQLESQAQQHQQVLNEMQEKLRVSANSTKKVEALKLHLKETVTKDSVLAANVLRGWIDEDGKV